MIETYEKPVCADSRFLAILCLGGGCFSLVFSNAMAAAACCALLIEGPDALYSSSPTSRQTVKDFLCAGPDSSVNCREESYVRISGLNNVICNENCANDLKIIFFTLYWCVVLLYRASSLIRHIGVLFSEMHKC